MECPCDCPCHTKNSRLCSQPYCCWEAGREWNEERSAYEHRQPGKEIILFYPTRERQIVTASREAHEEMKDEREAKNVDNIMHLRLSR
jgi:hypothetical protein